MKTIKILLLFVLASLFSNVNAQLRVLSDGRVQAGPNIPSLDQGKQASLLVLGSKDNIGTGAIIALGDFGTNSKNTFWGEYGNTDSDQLWFQGRLGYYLTYGNQASTVISYYDPAKNSNFVFNTNLRVNGVNITSDARMKDNIQPIENPIDILSRVDGVSYTYRLSEIQNNRKSGENAFPETSETATNEVNTALTEKEQRNERIKKEIEQREKEEANRKRIGFMAQDIQKVLPELVQTDEKGIMSIDYIGFIPLIVESLKQMQQTIQDQQKEIETLQSLLPAETKSMLRSTSNEEVSVVEGAKLFNRAGASVSYTLPAIFTAADLQVFDISGRLLKKVVLTGSNSIVEIDSSEIGYGTFIYALFVDGKKADILKKYIN
ncbi:tail fiber domain-containing protein [Parabacteroides sp. AF48-14]|uniref:tail fiber domain-containing protein n=1 Tax=Parabacteroides sp. AF48-14 TaxID=2292052 RepID=UPI000F00A789|nr:tail fiber domain-containing protein [Parabacteroides sp. AF48-14]RHO73857.1 tail fiber domain-containing protein [Parabacteroides sp. AF48-14]